MRMRISPLAALLPVIGLTLLSCRPPSGSSDVPLSMQHSAAEQGSPISNVNGDSTSTSLPSGPAPQLSYSVPPFPYGYTTQAFPNTRLAFFQGTPVSVAPSNVGPTITDCTITPDLPSGLTFSSSDCSIGGTPTAISPVAVYTVTATSSTGSSKHFVNISVSAANRKVINFPQGSYLFTRGTPITPIVPQLIGGALASECVAQQLPMGLTKQADCSITGTPSTTAYSAVLWNGAVGSITMGGSAVPPPGASGTSLGYDLQFLWQAVATNAPAITFGGKLFGQATLTLGQAIYPISPSNSGTSITSCVVTPALPAGLTLSQSDCSISGTPTALTIPTTYVISPRNGSVRGNDLPLNLIVQPAKITTLGCQSGTLCVHTMMPIWSQGDPNLLAYVNSHGYNVASDPGWCTGVSGAMLLKTYFQEMAKYTAFQSATLPAPFASMDNPYDFMFKSMSVMPTGIQGGGGSVPGNGLVAFSGQHGQSKDYFPGSEELTYSEFTIPSNYGHGMPLAQMGIDNPHGGPGHALSLNGVEGNYFKIFDPWGAVYNTTITYASNGSASMAFINGSRACLSYFGGTAPLGAVHWIKDYIFVSGAPAPTTR